MGQEDNQNIPHDAFHGEVKESEAFYLKSFHKLDRSFEDGSI